jgi:hypothetical protein
MDIHAKPGHKVVFTNKNGTEFQQTAARSLIVPGDVYTVKHVEIGNWCSYVMLTETGDALFNTVMFEDANGIDRAVEIMKEANNE